MIFLCSHCFCSVVHVDLWPLAPQALNSTGGRDANRLCSEWHIFSPPQSQRDILPVPNSLSGEKKERGKNGGEKRKREREGSLCSFSRVFFFFIVAVWIKRAATMCLFLIYSGSKWTQRAVGNWQNYCCPLRELWGKPRKKTSTCLVWGKKKWLKYKGKTTQCFCMFKWCAYAFTYFHKGCQ